MNKNFFGCQSRIDGLLDSSFNYLEDQKSFTNNSIYEK